MFGLNEFIPPKLKDMSYEPFRFKICNHRTYDFDMNDENYKIIFVLSGNIELNIIKKNIILKEGMIEVINPHNVYGIKVENDNNLSLVLEIDRDFVNGDGLRSIDKFFIGTEKQKDFHCEELIKQIKLLFLIYLSGNKNSIYFSKGLINKIVSKLKLVFLYDDLNDFYIDEWIEKQIINITKGMFRNLDGSYTLNGISDKFNSHPSRISKFYAKLFGFGFSDVYHFAQMKKSIELLLTTKENILDVAVECGFANAKPFHENYRKYIGLTPMYFRKSVGFALSEKSKYEDLDSALDSDEIKRILVEVEKDDNKFDDLKTSKVKVFEVDTECKGIQVENYCTKIVSKDMLGRRWKESIFPVQNALKFENLLIQIKFTDTAIYMKNENSIWEKTDDETLQELIRSLLKIRFFPIISVEIQKLNKRNSRAFKYYESAFNMIKYYINFLRNTVTMSILENWRFEIDISLIVRSLRANDYLIDLYRRIYNYLCSELPYSKFGIHMEEIDENIVDNYLFKDILESPKLPEFFSFKIIDKHLYDKNISEDSLNDRIETKLGFVQKIKDELYQRYEYSPKVYISSMSLYYDWNLIPKEYTESLYALYSIYGFLSGQKNKVSLASINYYDKIFENKENFYENMSMYNKRFEYINSYGIKNMNFYLHEAMRKMGKECIYNEPGFFVTKTAYDYECLLYQDISTCIDYISSDNKEKDVFLDKKFNIKLNGLYGKYKVIIKKFCTKDGTFYNEWKKMGAPDYLGEEEKEYLEAKVRPTLKIENVELFGKFEKNIELDLFEIAFIEMKKLYI